MRLALAGLWAVAAVGLGGSLSLSWWWAVVQGTLGPVTSPDLVGMQVLSSLNPPLLTAGLVAVVLALTVHATLWRRARLTPPAAPSP